MFPKPPCGYLYPRNCEYVVWPCSLDGKNFHAKSRQQLARICLLEDVVM